MEARLNGDGVSAGGLARVRTRALIVMAVMADAMADPNLG